MNQIKLVVTQFLWFYIILYEGCSSGNFTEGVLNLFCSRIWRPMWEGLGQVNKRVERTSLVNQPRS